MSNSIVISKVYSGMPIPQAESRWAINGRYNWLRRTYGEDATTPDDMAEMQRHLIQELGNIAGLEVVDSRIGEPDDRYKCFHFVFGALRREKWAIPDTVLTPDLGMLSALEFKAVLSERSYLAVSDEPTVGDTIVYSSDDRVRHAGAYKNWETVYSKWGNGPIVCHTIDLIPPNYGDTAVFYRKVSQQMGVRRRSAGRLAGQNVLTPWQLHE